MTYRNRLFVRTEEVDGERDWYWVKEDSGSWEGPKEDWKQSHVHKYFKHVKNYNIVITAGGNMGMYTRLYSNRFKAVYTFEPDPLNFHCLVLNNQRDNVFKLNCALGESCGLISINNQHTDTNRGMITVNDMPGKVPMLTLDSFNFPMCDLLQLDVEHYEYHVLKGARSLITKYRPVVVLEGGQTTAINQFMTEMSYEVSDQSVSDTIWIPK